MSEESNELLTSYQRIRKQLDQQSAENKILTEKVNSLVMLLEAEKSERAHVERTAIVEKINAINKDFKPDDSMDATALKWILRGLEIAPKSNATTVKAPTSTGNETISPQGTKPRWANEYLKIPYKDGAPAAVMKQEKGHIEEVDHVE